MSCLQDYAQRYTPLLSELLADFQEFYATGIISRARQLAEVTGQHFYADQLPLYFTGDPDGPVVLVHLNPKQANAPEQVPGWLTTAGTFEAYFDACRHFGARMYGPSSPRTHQSPFDHKQIRFLRPLGVIDFIQEHHRADRFTNLERMADGKLQLELVPYASASFSPRGFTPEVLAPHLGRILSTIVTVPRRYVLFCGAVFTPLLSEYVTRWHEFRLRKKDGALERQRSSFANLLLPYEGGYVRAGLAQSWARQGIPMTSYAEEIRSRYGMPDDNRPRLRATNHQIGRGCFAKAARHCRLGAPHPDPKINGEQARGSIRAPPGYDQHGAGCRVTAGQAAGSRVTL